MQGDDHATGRLFWHGPLLWLASAALGGLAGWGLTRLLPPAYPDPAALAPTIPLALVAPFALLLALIATMPLVAPRWWHRHFPDAAFFLGSLVAAYYLAGYARPNFEHALSYGQSKSLHAALEFYAFIALVGGLYVVSGGILIDLRGRARPGANTLLLALGAVLANLVGTTGASMLLIRPFLRANEGRVRPLHVVFFIFIVSNCGGALTPIGDPPLYLGYIKGVPFLWPLQHLWYDWLLVVGSLLAMFYVFDRHVERTFAVSAAPGVPRDQLGVTFRGRAGVVCLALMLVGVFLDPLVSRLAPHAPHLPYGATFQIAVALASYRLAPREILARNDFSFFPVKEVGLLFAGIFLTMMPALGYLSANGARLGVDTPTALYFATGALSAVLDNAPTYLNFLQVALAPDDASPATIARFLATPDGNTTLNAISTAAVFFGAMTYIGNGPNFMVRTIAESAGVRMPSFFAYLLWAGALLLPVLVLNWALFIR